MPNFPTYNSSNNINTTLGPQRNQASQPFEDNAKVIGTLQKITQGLSDAHDVMQETKNKTYYETAFAQQEIAAQNDPNPDNAEMHIKALEDIQKNAPKIDNQEVAEKVNFDMQHSAFLTGIKIQDLFKKKQLFANDVRLDQLATTTSQNKANAVSEAQGMQDEADFMDTVSLNVNKGLITPERGLALTKQYKLGVVKANIMKDPSKSLEESQVYKNLGKYGLDLQESETATKMIEANIKRNVQMDIQKTLKNRTDIIKGIASGDYSWQNADQIGKVAKQDPKLGEALQAVFNADAKGSPYKPEVEQNQNFADLVDKLFVSKTKEEVNDFLLKAINSTSERNMSRDRLSILINAAEQRGAMLDTNKESGDGTDEPHQKDVEANAKHIQDHIKDQPKDKNPFSMIVDYFKNLGKGDQPSQAKDNAIKSYNVFQYPWVAGLPKEGAVYRDKTTGAKRRIYPDGSFKEEK